MGYSGSRKITLKGEAYSGTGEKKYKNEERIQISVN